MRAQAHHAGASSRNRRSDIDIIKEYAAHQTALMQAGDAVCADQRKVQFAAASQIAGRISAFQRGLGAAAACAWSMAQVSAAEQS